MDFTQRVEVEALLLCLRNYAFQIGVRFLKCVVCYSTKAFFLDGQQFFPQLTHLLYFSGIRWLKFHVIPPFNTELGWPHYSNIAPPHQETVPDSFCCQALYFGAEKDGMLLVIRCQQANARNCVIVLNLLIQMTILGQGKLQMNHIFQHTAVPGGKVTSGVSEL